MSLLVKFIVGAACLLGFWVIYAQLYGFDEIEYRDTKIRLTKKYTDYDAYKNDEDNILTSELPRIERMIVDAKISSHFKDFRAFAQEAGVLKVSGYGFGGGPKVKAEGREFVVSSVEIPTRPWGNKSRIFVLEKQGDSSLKLVDDFVSPESPVLATVELRGSRLVYLSVENSVVRERQL